MPNFNYRLTLSANFSLNESQLKALNALAGYGTDTFLDVFYKHLGRSYLLPHEEGIRSLFREISDQVPAAIERLETAQKFLGKKGKDL